MTKDLLLAAVFLLNIALMAYITLDVLQRKKDSSAETAGNSADTKSESPVESVSGPVRKAGIGKSELNPKSWTKQSLKNVRQSKKKVCQA